MIAGAHVLLYSKHPEADRAFFRDVLEFTSVDARGGWLIFALPPAELAVHPSNGGFVQNHAGHDVLGAALYLMCDDLPSMVKSLEAKNVATAIAIEPQKPARRRSPTSRRSARSRAARRAG